MARQVPPEQKRGLEQTLAQVRVRGWLWRRRVKGGWDGAFYIVQFGGGPICRIAYRGQPDRPWECAIYKPSRDQFGSDGLVFPVVGDLTQMKRAVEMALNAFGYDSDETSQNETEA